MSSSVQGVRREGASFGVDAPAVATMLTAGAVFCALGAIALASLGAGIAAIIVGVYAFYFVISAGLYLHTSLRGKFAVWERLLDDLALAGAETVVDLGCGRGAVLLAAARRLPRGEAIGVDLWRTVDQSGNGEAQTLANARALGLEGRVQLRTADITGLPLGDASVDVVLSSLAIHNITHTDERSKALRGAVRVLRPGGRLVVVDFRHVPAYARVLADAGLAGIDVEKLGWRTWFGGPWFGMRAVRAVKPAEM